MPPFTYSDHQIKIDELIGIIISAMGRGSDFSGILGGLKGTRKSNIHDSKVKSMV